MTSWAPALPQPPETSLPWNPTTGHPPVPEQRQLLEVTSAQTTRTHLLTGSHTRSCTTATRSPGRGRWPGNRRSAQERGERKFPGQGPPPWAAFAPYLCACSLYPLWPGGSLGTQPPRPCIGVDMRPCSHVTHLGPSRASGSLPLSFSL